MKKVLSLILAMLMILTALFTLVACQEENPGVPGTDKPGTGTPGTNNPGGDEPGEEERLPIDYLPSEPYGSEGEPETFHILQWTVANQVEPGSDWLPWEEGDVEVQDGNTLGEAVFNRNAIIEQMYNIEITTEYGNLDTTPNYSTMVQQDLTNGGGTYDLMTARALQLTGALEQEWLYDMNKQEQYLHTDSPWWVADSVVSYTLGEHLYAACTEMLLRDKGATATLFYNKELAKDFSDELPDFYALVNSGEWTMDAMIEAADTVAHDESGNDMLDSNLDVWGMQCGDDTSFYLFNSCGYKYAHIDEDGTIVFDFGMDEDDNGFAVMQDIFDDVMYADWYLNTYLPEGKAIADGKNMFSDGNVFFKQGMLKEPATQLKEMKIEYGILPEPKLNVLQDNYSSLVWMHHDSVVAIPAGAKDKAYSAVVLEALSWESYYSVSTVFYEEILYARAAKDTPDKEMIQKILATRSYDPGQYWSFSSQVKLMDKILRSTATGDSNVASIWGEEDDAVLAQIQKINDLVKNIVDND